MPTLTDLGRLVRATLHAATHATDGTDPITPDSIGAQPKLTFGPGLLFDATTATVRVDPAVLASGGADTTSLGAVALGSGPYGIA